MSMYPRVGDDVDPRDLLTRDEVAEHEAARRERSVVRAARNGRQERQRIALARRIRASADESDRVDQW